MLKGYRTYIGLLITLLGVIGYGSLISEAEANQTINLVTELIGLGIAVYGRFQATR